jgi:hypothetical protein
MKEMQTFIDGKAGTKNNNLSNHRDRRLFFPALVFENVIIQMRGSMIWLSIGKQTITSVYLHLPIFCKIAIIIFDVFQSRPGVMESKLGRGAIQFTPNAIDLKRN